MTLADDIGPENAIAAQARMELDPPRKIDCLSNHPRVRHLATHELGRGWMLTKCGRRVINFFNANDTTLHYSDGSIYARECPVCFKS